MKIKIPIKYSRAALLLVSLAAANSQAQFTYVPIAVGTNNTSPSGVSGTTVVGSYSTNGQNAVFIYNEATSNYTTLVVTNAAGGASGIGVDSTNIVGAYRTIPGDGFSTLGFLYNGHTEQSLNDPSGVLTEAFGISGNYIVGQYDGYAQVNSGFIYNLTNGTFITLSDPNAGSATYQGTSATAIDGNNVIGFYVDSGGLQHGFLYNMTNGTYTTLTCPMEDAADGGTPNGISGNTIVGYYRDANDVSHGYIYAQGFINNGSTWATVDFPGAVSSGLNGISGNQIVGSWQDASGVTHGFLTTSAAAAEVLTNFPVASYVGNIAVNSQLNTVYLSAGATSADPIVQVNGSTFAQSSPTSGNGVAVDSATGNYWAAEVYSSSVGVWSSNNASLDTISLGDCPVQMAVDATNRRVWAAAQCGGGNDPLWAINADTYAIECGPIGSGGVQGPIIVNPATGRLYISPNGISKVVNPSTCAVTVNAFGTVLGVNPSANLLYAITNGNILQIINGAPSPEVVRTNIPLSFNANGYYGVNPATERLYVGASGSNFVAVFNATNGAPLGVISLGTNITGVGSLAVDAERGRVYALANSSGGTVLCVIQDVSAPVISSQPVNTTVGTGGTATLSVAATGYPLLYQWSFNGTNIAGATGATLTLGNVSAANVGLYSVTIINGLGQVTSQSVSLGLVNINLYAGVAVDGPSGSEYSIQSAPALNPANWTTVTNVTLGAQPYIYIDYSSPTNSKRFYRAVPLLP